MFATKTTGSESIVYSLIGCEKDANGAIISAKYSRADGKKETIWRAESLVKRDLEGSILEGTPTSASFKAVSVDGATYTFPVLSTFTLKRDSSFVPSDRVFAPLD